MPWFHIAKGMALWRRAAYRDGQRAFQFAIKSGNDRARHIASGEAGRMAVAFRKFKDARAHFQAQLFENPLGTGRDEALWGLGWVAYRTGEYDEARQYFDNLFNESPYGPKAAASLFWAAQSAMKLGLEELAFSEWMALVERFPTTYYAYRAQARVYERPDLGIRVAAATLAEPNQPKALSDAFILLRSNQPQAALKILYKWLPEARTLSSPKQLQLAIELSREAKDLNLAGKFSGILGRTYPFNHPNAARVLGSNFRSPHLKLMKRKAQQRGIPADIVIGLSRQESALNPNAVSPVGALGLMQLMPATAQSMAPKGKVWTREDVLNPSINIPLGVRYLKAMLREFDGQVEYALAAYNAGPGAANRWRRRYKGEEVEVFVEEIPYDETRQYVHKVFSWRLKFKYFESLMQRGS
jgi:soluble lytic murein transglycosylase